MLFKKGCQSNRYSQKGFSTLEILLAMTILIFTLSGVVLTLSATGYEQGVSSTLFGARSFAVDSRANSEALRYAQANMEQAQADARMDFADVKSATSSYEGDFYDNARTVIDISPCAKKVINNTAWEKNSGTQSSKLASLVTSPKEAAKLGGDCSAQMANPGDLSYPAGAGEVHISTAQGTDIDVVNGIIHLAVDADATPKPDFFTAWPPYNSATPDYVGIDLGGEGANAVDVAFYPDTNKYYAFVAVNFDEIKKSVNPVQNTYGAKFQFQVIDVTDYRNIDATDIVAVRYLPNIEGKCASGSCPGARSIYYYDKKVYIGTHEFPFFATDHHEFYIYDVADPTNPVLLGSKKITHNINKIFVKNQYAFLATSDNTGELQVYNVNDPTNIKFVTAYDAKTATNTASDNDALSLYILGNTAYLGRKGGSPSAANHHNLFILDISDPLSGIGFIGSKYIPGQGSQSNILDIVATSNMVFLVTEKPNEEFQIWNVSDPLNIQKVSSNSCFGSLPNYMTALDIENKKIYASFRSDDIIKLFDWGGAACP